MHQLLRRSAIALALLCTIPVGALAAGVVGTGSPASCDEAAFDAALAGGGTVTFNCGSATIAITSVKRIGLDTVIDGGGQVTLHAFGVQVFVVEAEGALDLEGVTLTGGDGGWEPGGGIRNLGSLTIRRSTLSGNFTRGFGGALDNEGVCGISDSTFLENNGVNGGGAIANFRTLDIRRTTLVRNTAGRSNSPEPDDFGSGGGIDNFGTLTISNSTISANTATTQPNALPGLGGGLHNAGTAAVVNCTFSANATTGLNDVGGGVANEGMLTLKNTIIANSAGTDCFNNISGVTTSDSTNNLFDDELNSTPLCSQQACHCGIGTMAPSEALRLAPLDDNGGPTLTTALLPGSVAIGAGDPATCADSATVDNVDQRGQPRFGPQDVACDIGAFELPFGAPNPTPTSEAIFLSVQGGDLNEPITGGRSFFLTLQNAQFAARHDFAEFGLDQTYGPDHEFGSVQIQIFGDESGGFWNLAFAAPRGVDLTVGDYSPVFPVLSDQEPTLLVARNLIGCTDISGGFSIREAVYSLDGTVEHFAADFEQYCDAVVQPMVGSIRLNSNIPAGSPGPFPTPTAGPCTGDCNGDGHISVAELVTGVNIGLDTESIDSCPAFDCRGTGIVTIGCLTQAVNAALGGCR